jgi:hypothetical protein
MSSLTFTAHPSFVDPASRGLPSSRRASRPPARDVRDVLDVRVQQEKLSCRPLP